MTQAEIICMAREAGFEVDEGLFPFEAAEDKYIGTERTLERFAALVAAHEREKQAEREPVAAYKDAPRVIYLQTGCEDPEFCECSFNEWGDTTWCADKIHDTDIPYIREDYAAPVRTKDLTDDEIAQAVGSPLDEVYLADFRAVIAKFKEKNNANNNS